MQTKEKYLKLGLKEMLLQNNFIYKNASHMLPRCTMPYVSSVRLIVKYTLLELRAKGECVFFWSGVSITAFKTIKH